MSTPDMEPLELQEIKSPFDDPGWLFEVKFVRSDRWHRSKAANASSSVAQATPNLRKQVVKRGNQMTHRGLNTVES